MAELRAPLVVVVGHSGCGACVEALATFDKGDLPPASILAVVRTIMPAVSRVPHDAPDRLKRVIEITRASRRKRSHQVRSLPPQSRAAR